MYLKFWFYVDLGFCLVFNLYWSVCLGIVGTFISYACFFFILCPPLSGEHQWGIQFYCFKRLKKFKNHIIILPLPSDKDANLLRQNVMQEEFIGIEKLPFLCKKYQQRHVPFLWQTWYVCGLEVWNVAAFGYLEERFWVG